MRFRLDYKEWDIATFTLLTEALLLGGITNDIILVR